MGRRRNYIPHMTIIHAFRGTYKELYSQKTNVDAFPGTPREGTGNYVSGLWFIIVIYDLLHIVYCLGFRVQGGACMVWVRARKNECP